MCVFYFWRWQLYQWKDVSSLRKQAWDLGKHPGGSCRQPLSPPQPVKEVVTGLIRLGGKHVAGPSWDDQRQLSGWKCMQSDRLVVVSHQQGLRPIILYRLLIECGIRIWKGTTSQRSPCRMHCTLSAIMGFITDVYSKALLFVLFSNCGPYFENGFLGNLHICMNSNEALSCICSHHCVRQPVTCFMG